MVVILVFIILFVIYNAERLPQIMDKIRNEVPHIVDAGKKASKELKEKAHEVQEKASAKKAKISQESIEKETTSKDN